MGIFCCTPALIAMFAGTLGGLSDLDMPKPEHAFRGFNDEAAAFVALPALGVVLSCAPFHMDGAVYAAVSIKLILFPAAVAVALLSLAGARGARNNSLSAGQRGRLERWLSVSQFSPDRFVQVWIWTSLLTHITLALRAKDVAEAGRSAKLDIEATIEWIYPRAQRRKTSTPTSL